MHFLSISAIPGVSTLGKSMIKYQFCDSVITASSHIFIWVCLFYYWYVKPITIKGIAGLKPVSMVYDDNVVFTRVIVMLLRNLITH